MPGMMTEPEIVALGKTTGPAFDQLFEKNLKEHLDQSIVLARSITTAGKDPATKKLARRSWRPEPPNSRNSRRSDRPVSWRRCGRRRRG